MKVFISSLLVKSGAALVPLSRLHPQGHLDGLAGPDVTLLMPNKTGKVFDGRDRGIQEGQFDASNEHIAVPPALTGSVTVELRRLMTLWFS